MAHTAGAAARKTGRAVGKTIKWTLMIAALIIVIVVIVAIVGIGKSVDKANKSSAKVTAHAAQIRLGMNEGQVKAIVGPPDSTQRNVDSLGHTDYWYYGTLATKGTWQLVFDNGRLRAKNRY